MKSTARSAFISPNRIASFVRGEGSHPNQFVRINSQFSYFPSRRLETSTATSLACNFFMRHYNVTKVRYYSKIFILLHIFSKNRGCLLQADMIEYMRTQLIRPILWFFKHSDTYKSEEENSGFLWQLPTRFKRRKLN